MTKTYAVVDTETGQLISVSTEDPSAKPANRLMTRLEFMRRLRQDEMAAIYALEESQPMVRVWMEMFRLAEEISLDDPDIQNGIKTFEAMGVLAAGRASEILS